MTSARSRTRTTAAPRGDPAQGMPLGEPLGGVSPSAHRMELARQSSAEERRRRLAIEQQTSLVEEDVKLVEAALARTQREIGLQLSPSSHQVELGSTQRCTGSPDSISRRELFDSIDADGNGTLDQQEILAFVRKLRPSRYMEIVLQQMDGKDEVAELMAATGSSHGSVTFEQFDRWAAVPLQPAT